ncbi:hypothetical protein ZWY2020_021235 [Hordeum vulgare]|nr:hypothetical protein ZWY2020_021235 [Hordeum vulgare]
MLRRHPSARSGRPKRTSNSCPCREPAELAGWEDEQIEFIREKVSEEGKQDDLKKAKNSRAAYQSRN